MKSRRKLSRSYEVVQNRTYVIYALACPVTYQFKYIGLTTDARNRDFSHSAKQKNLKEFIITLRKMDKLYDFVILAEVDNKEIATHLEKYFIQKAIREGVKLVNKNTLTKKNLIFSNKNIISMINFTRSGK